MPYWAKPPTAFAKVQAYDGTNWQNLLVQSADYKNLRVSVYGGDIGAVAFAGSSDARAPGNSGLCTQSYLYGFNGSSWDRLQVDPEKALRVACDNAYTVDTGTTTDDWTQAHFGTRWRRFLHKTIFIKNTGTDNSMDYKVIVGGSSDGIEYEETSGTLGPGDVVKIVLNNWYYYIKVMVKSSTAGAPTDYRIEIGGIKG